MSAISKIPPMQTYSQEAIYLARKLTLLQQGSSCFRAGEELRMECGLLLNNTTYYNLNLSMIHAHYLHHKDEHFLRGNITSYYTVMENGLCAGHCDSAYVGVPHHKQNLDKIIQFSEEYEPYDQCYNSEIHEVSTFNILDCNLIVPDLLKIKDYVAIVEYHRQHHELGHEAIRRYPSNRVCLCDERSNKKKRKLYI